MSVGQGIFLQYSRRRKPRVSEKIKFRKIFIWRPFCSPGGVEASFGLNGGRHQKENMAIFFKFFIIRKLGNLGPWTRDETRMQSNFISIQLQEKKRRSRRETSCL
jgi:hypothetical protein